MSSGLEFPAAFNPPAEGETPKKTSPRETAPKRSGSTARQTPLQGRLQQAIGGIGILVCMANEIDGMAIIEGSERLSIALDKAAKQNASVRRTLEAALTGSVWGEVAFAAGAIALPIAVNHNLMPTGILDSIGMQVEGLNVNANGNSPHPTDDS